jgi:hypothetical protein
MGICLALHSVSDKNIERILEFPPLIWRLIAPDDPEIYLESVNEGKKEIFSKLFGKNSVEPSQPVPDLEYIEGENIDDDLDKSWQGIHYCLNKTAYEAEPPMDFITIGGETAGEVEVGYGPARLINSKTVKEIDGCLSEITTELLRNNYNPSVMEKLDIYPNIWERDGEEGFEYIAEYFKSLRSFISNCSKHNLGMAVYLC